MVTTIISNGSRFAGEAPDGLDGLLARLRQHSLDAAFAPFIHASEVTRTHRFFGNFRTLSAVFNIDTSDPEVIARLTEAILANQQRPDYEPVLSGWAAFEALHEEQEEKGGAEGDATTALGPKLL